MEDQDVPLQSIDVSAAASADLLQHADSLRETVVKENHLLYIFNETEATPLDHTSDDCLETDNCTTIEKAESHELQVAANESEHFASIDIVKQEFAYIKMHEDEYLRGRGFAFCNICQSKVRKQFYFNFRFIKAL